MCVCPADKLRIFLGTARVCGLFGLEDKRNRAFAEGNALVENSKSAVKKLGDVGAFVNTRRNHNALITVPEDVRRIANALQARLIAVCVSDVVALNSRENREIASRRVIHGVRERERRAACRAVFDNILLEIDNLGKRSVRSTDDDTDIRGIVVVNGNSRVTKRSHTADKLKLRKSVELSPKRHFDAVFFIIIRADFNAVFTRNLTDTRDKNALFVCVVGDNARLLRKYDRSVVSSERKGV